jgi:hypothetical protein
MGELRAFLIEHRRVAAVIVAFALLMKALLPAGYMVGRHAGAENPDSPVCADASGDHLARQVSLPASGQKDGNPPSHDVCPFAGHAFAALGGADLSRSRWRSCSCSRWVRPAPLPRLARARRLAAALRPSGRA